MTDELDRLFGALVRVLAQDARLAVPFPASEIHERLVPYRSNRSRLNVATHQDYEMTVLRLLAGERGYVGLEPDEVRDAIQREIAATNPDTALFRNFPDARVAVNRFAAERFLRGDSAYAPPEEHPADELAAVVPDTGPGTSSSPPVPPPPDGAFALGDGPSGPGSPFELEERADALQPNHCPYCGGSVPTGRKVNFCPHCGQPPSGELKCPACGAEVDVGWAYCVGCGRATGFE
jgi:hypothetical protein